MTSDRKKTSSETFRTPRWLRGPPTYLRSILNREENWIYRSMCEAVIQELRPETAIEWIMVNEFVIEQFSAMRYATWQEAVMQFSGWEGLLRAVKNRLRSNHKGSEEDLNWKAQKLAGSMRRYVNDHAIEAEMYLSRRNEMDTSINDKSRLNVAGTHRCACWSSGAADRKRRRESPHGRAKPRGIWAS